MPEFIDNTQAEQAFIEVARAIAKVDFGPNFVWWNTKPRFMVLCNDLFYWACCDAEPVDTVEDVELLEKCIDICGFDEVLSRWLYACEKRQMRPQGAAFDEKHIPKDMHHHFLKFPKRETNHSNPVNAPNQFYKKPKAK